MAVGKTEGKGGWCACECVYMCVTASPIPLSAVNLALYTLINISAYSIFKALTKLQSLMLMKISNAKLTTPYRSAYAYLGKNSYITLPPHL